MQQNHHKEISNFSFFQKKIIFSLLLIIFIFGFSNSILAQDISSIKLDNTENVYVITPKIGLYKELIENSKKQQDIESIQSKKFEKVGKKIVTLNSENYIFWVKIPIQNNSDRKKWYLEIGNGLADVEVFISNDENPNKFEKISMGYSMPFSKRIIQTDRFLIPIDITKNQKKNVYVRLKSDYFQAPFHIAPLTYYLERDHKVDLAEGIYYGFVIVMALYNLFIFFTIREKGYLFYVLYLVSLGLAMAQLRGHVFEFLWFSTPYLNQYAPVIHSLVGIFGSLFLIDFLHTKKKAKFLHIILCLIMFIFSIALITALLGFKSIASNINQFTAALSTINALSTAIYIYYKGYKPAKFIIFAWTFYLIGVLLFVLAGIEVIPYTTFTSSSMLFGSAIEMVLLSVALAAKIEYYKKGKEELQSTILKESEKHREFVETQNKRLEDRVVERTEELNVVNEELSVNLERLNEQNIVIEKKNIDITASINYAKRIQEAMLPSLEEITTIFPNSFVFFKPRDIVSGDFYYFKQINQKIIIGSIDCTGHGVPGAFMSLIGNDLLNEIIERKSVKKASHILDKLDEGITKVLRQTDTHIRDGMDAAFCVYDLETKILEYTGAKNPLIYIENGELKIIKADRQSVGGNLIKNQHNQKTFTNHTINISQETSFYLFTDGFQDQFGGTNDKKFTTKRFRQTLLAASKLPFSEQEEFFQNTLKDWMGHSSKQIDDILVFGFKIDKTN